MRTWSLAAAAAILFWTAAAAARPFTIDDMLALRHVTATYIAPDGRHLIVGLSQPYDQGRRYGDLDETEFDLIGSMSRI